MGRKASILSEDDAGRTKTREDLDRRYGEIGISAVAAALRFQDDAKAAARTSEHDDRDEAEKAA